VQPCLCLTSTLTLGCSRTALHGGIGSVDGMRQGAVVRFILGVDERVVGRRHIL
jgi:purine-cytosine permease-like protein